MAATSAFTFSFLYLIVLIATIAFMGMAFYALYLAIKALRIYIRKNSQGY